MIIQDSAANQKKPLASYNQELFTDKEVHSAQDDQYERQIEEEEEKQVNRTMTMALPPKPKGYKKKFKIDYKPHQAKDIIEAPTLKHSITDISVISSTVKEDE